MTKIKQSKRKGIYSFWLFVIFHYIFIDLTWAFWLTTILAFRPSTKYVSFDLLFLHPHTNSDVLISDPFPPHQQHINSTSTGIEFHLRSISARGGGLHSNNTWRRTPKPELSGYLHPPAQQHPRDPQAGTRTDRKIAWNEPIELVREMKIRL